MQKLFLTILVSCALAASVCAHPDANAPKPADDTKPALPVVTGTGENTFATVPGWGHIPDKVVIGPTHGGVVVDKKGSIYISTDSANGIFVFAPDGSLEKNIAKEFPGIHGMMIREENGEQFIYAAHLKGKQGLKLKLDGTPVLKIPFGDDIAPLYPEGANAYNPTAIAVAPNGDIFIADGYGKSLIHKYDSTGKYIKTFGGKGKEDGKFETSHGIALDTRSGKPLLLICDRANRRLQHFDLDGNFVAVITTGLRLPCAVSFHGDHVAVAELEGRVAILDKSNNVVATLGDNPDKSQRANFGVPPDAWKQGVFTAPHGISYDAAGNLYVQDWNKTGRATKLVKSVAGDQ